MTRRGCRWTGITGLLLLVMFQASPAADPPALTILAAADLTFALKEIAPRFEKSTGAKGTLVFGSTGNFAKQVESGT